MDGSEGRPKKIWEPMTVKLVDDIDEVNLRMTSIKSEPSGDVECGEGLPSESRDSSAV